MTNGETPRDISLEERFRALADEAPVMIFLSDGDPLAERTFFNAQWTGFVGRSEYELSGDGWLSVVVDDDRAHLRQVLADAARKGEPYTVEYRVSRADGEERWLVERGSPRSGGGFAGTAADITSGRAARESLAASERRFRALVENSSDVVLLVDESGECRYASPSTSTVLGWESEPERITDEGLFHPEDYAAFLDAFEKARVMAGVSPTHATRVHDGDGSWRNVEVIFNNCLDEPEIRGVVLTLRDVTERLQSRETIERLRTALTSAKDEERRELAMALHDDTIQSILAAQWTLSSLNRVVESGSSAANQLEDVYVALEAAADSARAVLADLRVPDFELTTLDEALAEIIEGHVEAGGPPVMLQLDLDVDPPTSVSRVIYRIVREALINVRKHANATKVVVSIQRMAQGLEISVIDDGVGIEPGIVERRASQGHFGIVSLSEQVAQFSGSLALNSNPDGGSKLIAVLIVED